MTGNCLFNAMTEPKRQLHFDCGKCYMSLVFR